MSAEKLVSKLNHAKEVKARKGHTRSWVALCPSHDDKSPSLCIDEADNGKILIKCWAGCGANEVIDSVGMKYHDVMLKVVWSCISLQSGAKLQGTIDGATRYDPDAGPAVCAWPSFS